MPKLEPAEYLPVELYSKASEAFHAFSGIILFEFAQQELPGQELSKRDTIIRNFIARTAMLVKTIFRLWSIKDYQSCWILHRCVLDRLFHLNELHARDEFEVFEEWSFWEECKALNKVRSDPEFNGTRESKINGFYLNAEQKKREKTLAKCPPVWRRPKPEAVAKQLNMHFLYRFGYDYASRHVHPMANDGQQDFFTITKLEPAPVLPDQRSVLSNTLLVGAMILQVGLNASTRSWRALVYNFVDELCKFLENGANDYELSMSRVAQLFRENVRLCKTGNILPPPKN